MTQDKAILYQAYAGQTIADYDTPDTPTITTPEEDMKLLIIHLYSLKILVNSPVNPGVRRDRSWREKNDYMLLTKSQKLRLRHYLARLQVYVDNGSRPLRPQITIMSKL